MGINKAYTETEIKNMLGADQHGISQIERMRNRQNQITTTVKITFRTTIAPISVGTETVIRTYICTSGKQYLT